MFTLIIVTRSDLFENDRDLSFEQITAYHTTRAIGAAVVMNADAVVFVEGSKANIVKHRYGQSCIVDTEDLIDHGTPFTIATYALRHWADLQDAQLTRDVEVTKAKGDGK